MYKYIQVLYFSPKLLIFKQGRVLPVLPSSTTAILLKNDQKFEISVLPFQLRNDTRHREMFLTIILAYLMREMKSSPS